MDKRLTPNSLKLLLGMKFLDWAEKLPRFRGGTLAELQAIREHQRGESEKDHSKTRPPHCAGLELLYIRLVEMYHLEDFPSFHDRILQLFPNLDDPFRGRNLSAQFARYGGAMFGGGWFSLGDIVREKAGKFSLATRPLTEMSQLPPEVDRIGVELHHVFPSASLLSLDVYLTEKAASALVNLQNRRYLPVVRFRRVMPWGMLTGGYSQDNVSAVRQREICRWRDQLREKIEKCMRPFLSGYFMQQTHKAGPWLPAIEVFSLTGMPEEDDAFAKGMEAARAWWESFGLSLYPFETFQNEKVMFGRPMREDHYNRAACLIVRWESYLKSINPSAFGGAKPAVIYYTKNALTGLLPPITILDFLESARTSVERLRRETFQSMRLRLLARFRMRGHIKLADAIMQTSMRLKRLSMEFHHQRKWIMHEMGELAELRIKNLSSSPGRAERNLGESMLEWVDFVSGRLRQHTSFIMQSFSQYVSIRNMDAMYRLQRSIFWLTAVIVILTIAGLAANWEKLSGLCSLVAKFVPGKGR